MVLSNAPNRSLSPGSFASCLLAVGIILCTSASARADDPAEHQAPIEAEQVERESRIFEHLLVTGGPDRVTEVPGSAHYIGAAELKKQNHSDIHRILASVPGLSVQEEEGFGLRPNIGIRGTGVERSQKITLLEDGILIAPAPYSAPAAYYFPTAGRMEALEVRKGSGAISEGPYTTGGTINLISTGIPSLFAARVRAAGGSHGTIRAHATVGDSKDALGWVLETYQLDSDGFKDLDGGGATGVDLDDYLGKFRWNTDPSAGSYNAFEFKIGKTEQIGEETYLGLTRTDFAETPYRRYAASGKDSIQADHEQYQLRYLTQPTAGLSMTVTAYRNDFFRNWHKLQSVAGLGLAQILDAPETFPGEFGLLDGSIDGEAGELAIRNNRRNYFGEGLDLRGTWAAGTKGTIEFGLRWHQDEEDRFQEEDLWSIQNGSMELFALGQPGSQSNRVSSADSWAGFVRYQGRVGERLTITPGVRFESIDFERRDFGSNDSARTGNDLTLRRNSIDELLPGVGLSFRISDRWQLFGGVHQGFAPPGPGKSPETEPEESVNFELGANFGVPDLHARFVLFASEYDNLLGRDTLSIGGEGTGDAFNGGQVSVSGLEASLAFNPAQRAGKSASTPISLSYTYTDAEFGSSFETSFADWAPSVRAGDALPYLAEHHLVVSSGWVGERAAVHLSANYRSQMRSRPGQGAAPLDTVIEEALLFDLSTSVSVLSGLQLFAEMRNLTDEVYLVARRPAGARPGLPRSLLLGLEWRR